MIVAGDGAAASGAGPEVLALAEALAAPVATTLGARGIIPTTHRLSAGVAGSYSAPPANRIVHGAELVLFIGCDTGDQVTLNWRIPPIDTKIVQIEADPLEIGRSYPNTTGLVGDPKATLARLRRPGRRPAGARRRLRRGGRADRRRLARQHGAARREEHRADRRRAAVRRDHPRLARDGVLVADTGYSGIWTGTMIELNGAGQTYLRAAGSLGWAFPASLGAKCAAGAAQGRCVSPAMAGSTTTSPNWRRRAAAASRSTIVINNNSGFGQNLTGVHRISGNRPGRGEELIRFGPTDFTEVARASACAASGSSSRGEIAPALQQALAADEPVVVDVVTDLEPRAPEAWAPPRPQS